jgi:tyrosyl-tRNA synthetase
MDAPGPPVSSPVMAEIDQLVRGAVKVLPEGALAQKLALGRPLRVKFGIDPTARDIHIGNAIPLQRMRAFQEQGHVGVLIIGDYTARVGDPSGRSQERKILTDEQIDGNAKAFFEQAARILDPERTELRFNSEWLGKLDFAELLRLTRTMTVSRMLERNDFEKRFKAHQPISISEFLYPLMQGYDSVAIRADVELGGTDQEYNLLAARDIQIAYGVEPQVVLTTPLINGPNGVQKMSASLNNYIGIAEAPGEMFGKAMSVVDELMPQYYDLTLESDAPPPSDPYLAKREFARRLVERWHGAEAAAEAERGFDRQFKEGRAADDAPVGPFPDSDPVHMPAYLADNGLASSRGEARRLIAQGGVRIDGVPLEAAELDVERSRLAGAELRVGRRFMHVSSG